MAWRLPPNSRVAFWRLHYHLVWATDERQPLINAASAAVIWRTVYGKAKELAVIVHAVGGMADHVHLVVSVPPQLALAECVRQLKGASSHAVNLDGPAATRFRWQAGYGALSVGGRSLPDVVAYVRHQGAHHRNGSTLAVYERTAECEDGPATLAESAGPE